MSQPSDKILKNEYLSRLNRTIDYIHSHSHEDLNLARVAEVACFSKFHFHRIFKAILGETVNCGSLSARKAIDALKAVQRLSYLVYRFCFFIPLSIKMFRNKEWRHKWL